MGSALSSGSNSPDDCSLHEFSSPSDTSWAQMHARVTKLPVNVVENLWADYRNLELNQAGRESVISTDRLHPEITIKRFADVFFAQMDTSREGVVTEDKFLDWLMTSTPKVQFMVLEKLAPPETPPVPV